MFSRGTTCGVVVTPDPQDGKNSDCGSEIKINTYKAPRTVTTVAPELVAKTPHRSMAGTTQAEVTATIIFLTPLEYDERNLEST